MKKRLFGVFICMLMVLTAIFPISSTTNWRQTSQPRINMEMQYRDAEKILNDLTIKFQTVTTKQEALILVNKAITGLHDCGFLPKGLTVKQAQQLVTGCFSKFEFIPPLQTNNENNTGNTNCLVIGFANETFFRPYPTIYDIPIIYYLLFNTIFGEYFNFLIWFYAIRASQPFKLGPYALVGGKGRLVENGNITQEYTHASSGWVWSFGSNGVRTWNGTFYGGLKTRYNKIIIGYDSYIEDWNPLGIIGFVGMNFFSVRTFWNANRLPTFYIGFAREINFTYTPPWT